MEAVSGTGSQADPSFDGAGDEWFMPNEWGFKTRPGRDVLGNYAHATTIMAACAAVDEFSEEQRDWIIGYMRHMGVENTVLNELQMTMSNSIDELLPKLAQISRAQPVRPMLFDCIRCASQGRYGPEEKEALRKAAAAVGVDEQTVGEIEEMVFEEARLKAKRHTLLFPEGIPF